MGTRERREREKGELRAKILDAARTLFMKDGYDAVSMRKIAEAIEYSPTAIYQYFPDKTTLVLALCEADFREWGQRFFALEPVSHANDGFNLLAAGVPDSGVRVLEPGETLAGTVRLAIAA